MLLKSHESLMDICKSKIPDTTETAAISSILHSFYNGIEKIFIFIVKYYDNFIPSGEKWHRDLIKRMNIRSDKRDKILSDTTKEIVLIYMGVRHFIRHSYDFQIDWNLIRNNFLTLKDNWNAIKSDIITFVKYLNEK